MVIDAFPNPSRPLVPPTSNVRIVIILRRSVSALLQRFCYPNSVLEIVI
jgi:hypothetical protein